MMKTSSVTGNSKDRKSAPEAETALIIHPVLKQHRMDGSVLGCQLEEAKGLAQAIFLDVVEVKVVNVSRVTSAWLIGKGARADIKSIVKNLELNLVIVNCGLSPVQQRNLERQWDVKVIDRTGLILEIFWRTCPNQRRENSGRAGCTGISKIQTGPLMDTP